MRAIPSDDDYYTVLQVLPNAEPEIIDAAYRQLMRMYHPDMAGADAERAAELHELAKRINRAYAVLRDPHQRLQYDGARSAWAANGAMRRPPGSGEPAQPRRSAASPDRPPQPNREADQPGPCTEAGGGAAPWAAEAEQDGRRYWVVARSRWRAGQRGPAAALLDAVASVYYFLPGPYEWERERNKDLLATWMLPPLGVAGWSLASGRLNLLTRHAPYLSFAAWSVLALLALPLWPTLPRLVLASAPMAVMLTGQVNGMLSLAGIPPPLAWIGAVVFGIVAAPRLYLFAVLPTVALCWILASASRGLGAFEALVTAGAGWLATGSPGALALAGVVGLLSWTIVFSWPRAAVPAETKPTPASPQAAPGQAAPAPPAAGEPLGQATRAAPRQGPPGARAPNGAVPNAAGRDAALLLFERVAQDRVRAVSDVPLRGERDLSEPPNDVLDAQQEANVLLVLEPWAFVQTDDGREGWTPWPAQEL